MSQDNENEARIRRRTTSEGEINFNVVPDVQEESFSVPRSEDKTPIEALDAKGFSPDLPRQEARQSSPKGTDITRGPLTDSRNNIRPGAGAAPQPVDPREAAPDIGKDYGSDLGEPGYNGYRKDAGAQQGQGVQPPSGVPERDNPVRAGVPETQTPEQRAGLNKKDGLEKKDGKEETKASGDQKDANGGQSFSEEEAPTVSRKDVKTGSDRPEETDGDKKEPRKDGKKDEINQEAPASIKKKPETSETGNGYGALKKPNQGTTSGNDSISRARRNLEHTRRMQQGDTGEQAPQKAKGGIPRPSLKKSGAGDNESGLGNLGAKFKNGLRSLLKGNSKDEISETEKGGKSTSKSFVDNVRKIGSFIIRHPYASIAIGVVALILLILIITCIDDASSGGRGLHCTYNLNGVSSTGEVKLEGLQVELINCDGSASNYTVLETVDFEKYVLGVALAEIGSSSPDEAIKAQIIAARGFALKRNSGMCPGNQDGCFYGYNASTGKIRMRACEADQVYWDYEKDIYRQERGSISIYSPEINSGTLWKAALSEERKAQILALAEEVKGKVLVDSSNNVISTNYVASVSQQFISKAQEGKTYEQILSEVYTDSDGFSVGQCTSYGNIDYGDYVLSSEGHEILHQPLDTFLKSQGTSLEEFNALIASNVEKAGYGTRAGVVAAAVTLIAELGNNYGVKVPYYWGGGHYDGVVVGALGYWGSTQCHTYANNTSYNYCGLDCSGFVPWAVKNGGFNMTQNLAHNFQNLPGVKRVTLSNSPVLEPGDLLESSAHVVLVVGIEETTGNYICAEASGNSQGVLFTRRPFNSSGYWGVKMDGYYEANVRSQ